MPLYKYVCPKCGHSFEKLCRVTDNKELRCPECGSKKAMRVFPSFRNRRCKRSPSAGFG